jgi:hypothetical protein
LVILETLVDSLHIPGSVSTYYPGNSLGSDPTNHFGPNLEALVGMIRTAGFSNWEFKGLWEWNTVGQLGQGNGYTLNPLTSGRVVLWLYP